MKNISQELQSLIKEANNFKFNISEKLNNLTIIVKEEDFECYYKKISDSNQSFGKLIERIEKCYSDIDCDVGVDEKDQIQRQNNKEKLMYINILTKVQNQIYIMR